MSKTVLTAVLWLLPLAVAQADLMMEIAVVPTDLSGNPITSITAGAQFQLEAIVQDIRSPAPPFPGVFSAYLDVTYFPAFTSIANNAPITFGPTFTPPLAPNHNFSTPGKILDTGTASTNITNPGPSPQLLWVIPATAGVAGVQTFTPSFNGVITHDALLYGYNFVVLKDEIRFVGASLTIVPEPSAIATAGLAFLGLLALASRKIRRG